MDLFVSNLNLFSNINAFYATVSANLFGPMAYNYSNNEMLQKYQSDALHFIVNASWFVSGKTIYVDIDVSYVRRIPSKYLSSLNNRVNKSLNYICSKWMQWNTKIERHSSLDLPFKNELFVLSIIYAVSFYIFKHHIIIPIGRQKPLLFCSLCPNIYLLSCWISL